MERGDGGGGMAPRGGVVGSAAMLGLDMQLAPQQMHPAAAFQHQQGGFQLQQPAPVAVRQQQQQAPAPPSSFSPYSNTSSSRVVVSATAVGVGVGHDDDMVVNGGKGGVVVPPQQQQLASAACPWTRMKWTDAMVRLLIRVVDSVGDDGEGVATAGGAGGGNKAGRAGSAGHGHAAAAQQQKKGKWKSVSHAMMDKGFIVSPQQCEDKFNDLNKRYKRVIDLLGRGRACRVVENHALLDTINDLSPKAKDEARKLLSSKHLFFREMCAYHNSTGAAGGSHQAPHAGAGDAACLHHPAPAPVVAAAASSAARHAYAQQHQQLAAPSPPGMKDSSADVADDDEDDDSDDAVSDNGDEDEADYDDDEEDGRMFHSSRHPASRRQHSGGRGKRGRGEDGALAAAEDLDDEAEGGGGRGRWRARRAATRVVAPDPSAMLRQLKSELASAPTAAMDPQQARCWARRRAVEVEGQQILLETHACHLDAQRLKWERFRANKERDMERERLQNERLRMESRRLLLMLRHRDLELDMAEANSSSVDHHPGASPLAAHQQQQQPVGSSPSPSTAGHPN